MVSYHFGPAGPVGGLRWWALTKYLAREGWDCHVVSATDASSQSHDGESAPPGVTHCYVPPGRTIGEAYRRWRRSTGGNGTSASTGTSAAGAGRAHDPFQEMNPVPPSGLTAVRGEVAALLAAPDDARGWILRATRAARRDIHEHRPAVVVSSGPPHSVHVLTAAALKGAGDVRWLVDLRDPWGQRDVRSPNVSRTIRRSRWLRHATNWLEDWTLASAAGFITTTPELAEALAARGPSALPYCLTNGIDEEWLPPPTLDPYPGFSVAHVGTLYARRDPRPLLRAFRKFLDREPSARHDGSRIRFAGSIEGPYQRMIDLAIAELGLEEHVEMLGLVSRDRAIDVLSRSSVAIVLTQQQLLQIPAKLYEPVAMGLPTLALATRGSATAVAAGKLGIGHAEPDDVDGIAAALHAVYRGDCRGVSSRVASGIHYGVLARDAERILVHDPEREALPTPPAWIAS